MEAETCQDLLRCLPKGRQLSDLQEPARMRPTPGSPNCTADPLLGHRETRTSQSRRTCQAKWSQHFVPVLRRPELQAFKVWDLGWDLAYEAASARSALPTEHSQGAKVTLCIWGVFSHSVLKGKENTSLDSSVSFLTTSEFQASLNTKKKPTKYEVMVCVDDDLQLVLLGPCPPTSASWG